MARIFTAALIVSLALWAEGPAGAQAGAPRPALGTLEKTSEAGADAAAHSGSYDGLRIPSRGPAGPVGYPGIANLTARLPDPREPPPRLRAEPKSPDGDAPSKNEPLSPTAWMGIGFLGAVLAIIGFATIWPLGIVGLLAFGTAVYKLATHPDTIVKIEYPDGSVEFPR